MPRPKDGYRLKNGAKVPGVTDITGRYMNKEALIGWAFKRGKAGATSLYEREQDIGTIVHTMIELSIKGTARAEIESRPEQLREAGDADKARAAFAQFEQWMTRYHVEVEAMETSLVSEQHRYGGTLDWLVKIAGKRALLDFKTCKSPVTVYPDNLIQLAAYKPLWQEHNIDRPINGGFHLLRLPKDGGAFGHFYYRDLATAQKLFLAYRKAYDVDQMIKSPGVLMGDAIPPAPKPKPAPQPTVTITPRSGRLLRFPAMSAQVRGFLAQAELFKPRT